jgi:hypothetical protein
MSTADVERRIEDLPCLHCTDPRGADLRHALAQAGGIVDENQCSPVSHLPLGCADHGRGLIMPRQGRVSPA